MPDFRTSKEIEANLPECILKKFHEKVKRGPEDKCWPYGKGTTYGIIPETREFRGSVVASRVAWIIKYGPIPKEKFVIHHCGRKNCCNPSHLYLGIPKRVSQRPFPPEVS